jgi:hypothetical protein
MYSCTLPSTSALGGVVGQLYAPAALPPGKTRYPLYRRLGGPQGRFGRVRKLSPPPGFDPRTVKPLANRYTDWAIPGHFLILRRIEIALFVNVQRSSCKMSIILVRFESLKLGFSRQNLEKSPNMKFHENLSSGIRVVPFGLTGGHDEASTQFSQFCERA